MSGKYLFKIFSFVLLLFSFFFRFTPVFFRNFLWQLSSPFEGYLALSLRYLILRSFLWSKCGDNIFIGKNVVIKNFDGLSLGSNISIHANSYIDAAGGVYIGDEVSMAHNSSIVSFEHTWGDIYTPIKYNPTKLKGVYIGSDVWIGCGVRVLAGSQIKERTVIAAGAVVRGPLVANGVYAGVPAKKVKDIL